MSNVIQLSTSRRFLVTQSVLNAAQKHFTLTVAAHGMRHVLCKIITSDATSWEHFCKEVGDEYRILTGTYTEVPDVEVDDCAFTDPDFADAVNASFAP